MLLWKRRNGREKQFELKSKGISPARHTQSRRNKWKNNDLYSLVFTDIGLHSVSFMTLSLIMRKDNCTNVTCCCSPLPWGHLNVVQNNQSHFSSSACQRRMGKYIRSITPCSTDGGSGRQTDMGNLVFTVVVMLLAFQYPTASN